MSLMLFHRGFYTNLVRAAFAGNGVTAAGSLLTRFSHKALLFLPFWGRSEMSSWTPLGPGRECTLALGNHSARPVPAAWLSATIRAEPLNLRFERPPTLCTWGSDTCILHFLDTPYGRTCHRCTCHPHERPWNETRGL